MLFSLAACVGGNGDGTSDTAGDTSSETEPAEIISLIAGGASDFEVVISSKSTSAEFNAASSLIELFSNKTGIKLNRKYETAVSGETGKLLVGETGFALSAEAYTELMYNDWRIIAKDGNIAVAAYTEEGFNAALAWLSDSVFKNYADGRLDMEACDVHKALVSDFDIPEWKIDGVLLGNYKIVYGDEAIASDVEKLRSEIAEKTGWYLKTGLDKKTEESKYEILIGETDRTASAKVDGRAPLNYIIKNVDGKLVVKYGGEHSRIYLLENFIDIVQGSSSKIDMNGLYELNGDMYDDPNDSSKAKGTDLRIMSANVMANLDGWDNGAMKANFSYERRMEIFFASLDYYEPTVVGVQECDPSFYEKINDYWDIDNWAVLKFKNPNKGYTNEYVFSTVMYRSDLYTLVDSGMNFYSKHNNARCRCITWAILKDKKTGKQFCMVSTHWDQSNSNTLVQAQELSDFVNNTLNNKNIPVFTTGDFNSNESSEAWKKFMGIANSYDCMHADESVRVNVQDSWHGWGEYDKTVGGSCDHITSTKANTKVLKFETIIYNEQIWASDHAWLIADIKFTN